MNHFILIEEVAVDTALSISSLLEEVKRNLLEHTIREHVLFLLNPLWDFCAKFLKLRLK